MAGVARSSSRGLKRWQPEEGLQGAVVFLGSIASVGNVGQISHSSTKAGLEGMLHFHGRVMYYGVRSSVIHPGLSDTPMVQALGEEYIKQNASANAVETADQAGGNRRCHSLYGTNAAVSGELWPTPGGARPPN